MTRGTELNPNLLCSSLSRTGGRWGPQERGVQPAHSATFRVGLDHFTLLPSESTPSSSLSLSPSLSLSLSLSPLSLTFLHLSMVLDVETVVRYSSSYQKVKRLIAGTTREELPSCIGMSHSHTPSPTHSLSLTHLHTQLHTHSFTYTHSLTHSHTHSML